MNCPVCKTPYSNEHFRCIETFVDYPENHVVTDMIARKPDIFQFLFTVVQSQVTNPARFRPVPSWFATQPAVAAIVDEKKTEDLMNMARFRAAVEKINVAQWREWVCPDDVALMRRVPTDAYMLTRFIVLFCSLQLEGVDKIIDKGASSSAYWQQFKVTWSEAIEQQWERSGESHAPEYLYHGSPLANWYSIMRNGLKVTSGTKWMTTGAVLGNGIYCSDTLTVSWSYSHGGIVPAIVIGVYEVWGAAQYRKTPGYFVIPHEEQLLLRYLIYLPDSRRTDVTALDNHLRAEWVAKAACRAEATRKKNIRIEARLKKEVATLESAGIHVSLWNTGQVRTWIKRDGKLDINIDIAIPHQFPFSAPTLFTDAGPVQVSDWTPKSTLLEALLEAKIV